MQTISKCMTNKLITINENDALSTAYRTMQTNNIRHLPVLNRSSEVVGIISDRDLLRALKTQIIHQPGFKIEDAKFDPTEIVYEYMSSPVKAFDKKTPVEQVVKTMIADKISCYLISDGQDIVGIVSSENFLHLLLNYIKAETAPSWSLERILNLPWVQSTSNSLSQAGI